MYSAESARRLADKPYRVIAANAADADDLRRKLKGYAPPDVLIHCLSGHGGRDADAYRITYVETLRNLLEVLRPSFGVFTGSTSVYPQNDGSAVTEQSLTGGTPTGDVLLEAERLSLGTAGAVVRLGGIYGPGRTRFIEAARTGQPTSGDPDGFINFIHRDDAAAALQHVGHLRLGGLWNAVDDCPVRRAELAEAIRNGSALPHLAAVCDRRIPVTGKRVRNAKLRAAGWTPHYPTVIDALKENAV